MRRPRGAYTGYDEVRTLTVTLTGVAPLVGTGTGPFIPAKAVADPRATVRAAAAATRRPVMRNRFDVRRAAPPLHLRERLRHYMDASSDSRSAIPGSDPRPVATALPAAHPRRAASSSLQPSSFPRTNPALNASPHPVVSTTSTSGDGTRVRPPAEAMRQPSAPRVTTTVRAPSESAASHAAPRSLFS